MKQKSSKKKYNLFINIFIIVLIPLYFFKIIHQVPILIDLISFSIYFFLSGFFTLIWLYSEKFSSIEKFSNNDFKFLIIMSIILSIAINTVISCIILFIPDAILQKNTISIILIYNLVLINLNFRHNNFSPIFRNIKLKFRNFQIIRQFWNKRSNKILILIVILIISIHLIPILRTPYEPWSIDIWAAHLPIIYTINNSKVFIPQNVESYYYVFSYWGYASFFSSLTQNISFSVRILFWFLPIVFNLLLISLLLIYYDYFEIKGSIKNLCLLLALISHTAITELSKMRAAFFSIILLLGTIAFFLEFLKNNNNKVLILSLICNFAIFSTYFPCSVISIIILSSFYIMASKTQKIPIILFFIVNLILLFISFIFFNTTPAGTQRAIISAFSFFIPFLRITSTITAIIFLIGLFQFFMILMIEFLKTRNITIKKDFNINYVKFHKLSVLIFILSLSIGIFYILFIPINSYLLITKSYFFISDKSVIELFFTHLYEIFIFSLMFGSIIFYLKRKSNIWCFLFVILGLFGFSFTVMASSITFYRALIYFYLFLIPFPAHFLIFIKDKILKEKYRKLKKYLILNLTDIPFINNQFKKRMLNLFAAMALIYVLTSQVYISYYTPRTKWESVSKMELNAMDWIEKNCEEESIFIKPQQAYIAVSKAIRMLDGDLMFSPQWYYIYERNVNKTKLSEDLKELYDKWKRKNDDLEKIYIITSKEFLYERVPLDIAVYNKELLKNVDLNLTTESISLIYDDVILIYEFKL